ncbi:DeoR/GlpR family DNA-binding transcription regulator [Metabacillus arenae]|uniref:DeoR/GlpR transcriptional regulator n=1 Tax=Metabacillus arenae TaxID=2771434 RepID=A0A926NIU0_9BACI|nr:DeoR/GlpR family DNA-binding transcription regulator [Metabacillus arenae]MBD1381328.1 DeoR/GlpR transcriptional regulator [Metabacillus arenae]
MLTPERHKLIVDLVKEKNVVKIQELVEVTNSSESTIRRDLTLLEDEKQVKRIHGGAAKLKGKLIEPDLIEKSAANLLAKKLIAKHAASLIENGDSIFLDAGTTTLQMVPYLTNAENIVVVTNSISLIQPLIEKNIKTFLIGGYIKPRTAAMVGRGAIEGIKNYRFDKAFLGANGIHHELGYTTPDPDEANIKRFAVSLSREPFILADSSKLGEVSFSNIADLEEAVIITDEENISIDLESYQGKTEIKVVK